MQMVHAASFRSRWWIAFFSGVVILVLIALAVFPYGSFFSGSSSSSQPGKYGSYTAYPTASHPIAGKTISLPASMYATAPLGDGVDITTNIAVDVADAAWPLFERAMVTNDTNALTELLAPGAFRTGFIMSCALDGSACSTYTTPLVLQDVTPVIPIEHQYPLYFLAQLTAQGNVPGASGSPSSTGVTVEEIFTKAAAAMPWQIAFLLQFPRNDNGTYYEFPFEFEDGTAAGFPQLSQGEFFNPAPTEQGSIPESDYETSLATYWQTWKDTGAAPASSLYPVSGDAWSYGKYLGSAPEGFIYQGSKNFFSFSAAPSLGLWRFTALGGYPMVCGSILDMSTNLPASSSGVLYQDSSRENWGASLPPGTYTAIHTKTIHLVCIFSTGSGLEEIGGYAYDYATYGTQ
ncbi:MAG: hypothetical protein ACP5OR_02840 [Candidatus Dormibacteria bacterium]